MAAFGIALVRSRATPTQSAIDRGRRCSWPHGRGCASASRRRSASRPPPQRRHRRGEVGRGRCRRRAADVRPPKSTAGGRTVAIPPHIIAAIERRQARVGSYLGQAHRRGHGRPRRRGVAGWHRSCTPSTTTSCRSRSNGTTSSPTATPGAAPRAARHQPSVDDDPARGAGHRQAGPRAGRPPTAGDSGTA